MRNLITGGAGFIGSHLAELLLAQGDEVAVLDDLSTGSIRNIAHLKGRAGFEHHIAPLAKEGLLAELVDWADCVHHLAAAVGVRLIIERPVHTIETNVHGTELVLKHAAKKGRLVFIASTSEVYGKSQAVPFKEDDDMVLGPTTHHRWSYACSKAIDEFLALSYWKEKKTPVVIGRLFNTVGPRQVGRYGMVVPRFVEQALAGGPVTVYGDGRQSRCFCHVQDSVRAILALTREPRAVGGVYNIGSEEEVTISALAERVRDRLAPQAEIAYLPYDQAYEQGFEDMRRRVPDCSKIRALVGWRPTKGLDEIVGEVADHLRREAARR